MQVVIDVSLWTQEQKNFLQAAAYTLLYQQAGIDAADISVKDGIINIPSITQDVGGILSQSNLKNFIDAEFAKQAVASQEAQVEAQAKELELATSQFVNIKLVKVDTAIDAVTNLAELKVLLKKFARYVIARS